MRDYQSIENQKLMEHLYSRANIRKHIRKDLADSPEIQKKIEYGIQLLTEFIEKDHGYVTKNLRILQLRHINLRELIEDILEVILVLPGEELLTSVVGRLAHTMHYSNQLAGIKTLAEILAVLCRTDLFDILREPEMNRLTVQSRYQPSKELAAFIAQTKYIPPMVCAPNLLKNNYDSAYLTRKDSLILGTGNFHTDDICLDSLNKFNQVTLSLNVDILKLHQEMPTTLLDTYEKQQAHDTLVRESMTVYLELVALGNRFHLTHKVDKRGRTYSQGYHVNTQGSKFKRSIIELHKKELIDGI